MEAKSRASEVIKKFDPTCKDSGSVEVQVALFTGRIKHLTEHFKVHKKDQNSRRGLFAMIGKRSALLKYLKGKDETRHKALVKKLGLRH